MQPHHLAVSAPIADLLIGRGWFPAARVSALPNGVALPSEEAVAEAERRRRAAGASREVRVGSIMEFRTQKDHATLLRAFAALGRAAPRARLILVGDGPRRTRIEELARQLGIRERVEFTGTVADPQPLLATWDILAHAAEFEGQGLALLEAMAWRLPVVATGVAGVRSTATHGREGLLVAPRDPAAFARALRQLVRDADLRQQLGRRGRRRVADCFSLQTWGTRMLRLYATLTADPAAMPSEDRCPS
ncbi:MAG: glycosyltransferase [Candidatus Eisenbacteria bacterium]|nr:glycosyltransferase [Candidatus Eisenbacteria bacterium]